MLDFTRFEISHYGFLPVEEPLHRLPDAYYEPWEAIISRIDKLIRDRLFYLEISKLPVLDTKYLQTVPEWQRAYVILCFFTHAHIWSDDKPREVCIRDGNESIRSDTWIGFAGQYCTSAA